MAHRAILAGVSLGRGVPVAIMGALNVSPESFHAGSVHTVGEELLAAALAMVDAGAALIDVGARSTAPYGASQIGDEDERNRLGRAVGVLATKVPVPISADTTRPGPARAALDAGARIINDVSGLRDPEVAALVSDRRVGLILMASPEGVVRDLLAGGLRRTRAAGIPDERVVLDPGIGFFRNEAVAWGEGGVRGLAGPGAPRGPRRPLFLGGSRKAFFWGITGPARPPERAAGAPA